MRLPGISTCPGLKDQIKDRKEVKDRSPLKSEAATEEQQPEARIQPRASRGRVSSLEPYGTQPCRHRDMYGTERLYCGVKPASVWRLVEPDLSSHLIHHVKES